MPQISVQSAVGSGGRERPSSLSFELLAEPDGMTPNSLGTGSSLRLLSFEEVVQALSMDQRWHHARLPPTPHR